MNKSTLNEEDTLFNKENLEKFVEEHINEQKKHYILMSNLYLSSLFSRMVKDLIKHNYTINTDDFAYQNEEIKENLKWHDITDEQINLFFDILTSEKTPDDKESTVNQECPFSNVTFYKHGLEIFIMHGQGTFIKISPIAT